MIQGRRLGREYEPITIIALLRADSKCTCALTCVDGVRGSCACMHDTGRPSAAVSTTSTAHKLTISLLFALTHSVPLVWCCAVGKSAPWIPTWPPPDHVMD